MRCSASVAVCLLAFAASAQAFTSPLVLSQPSTKRVTSRSSVTSLKALDIPAGYGAVMSTAAFSAGMVQWAAIQVAIARKKYGVKYPKMYEGTEDSVFDCVQRAHQNTLEYLPSFLALLMLNGLAAPYSTAAAGMVWNIARYVLAELQHGPGTDLLTVWGIWVLGALFGCSVIYVIGYGKGDPNGRLPGAAVSGLAFLGLILATFGNGVAMSGLLPA